MFRLVNLEMGKRQRSFFDYPLRRASSRRNNKQHEEQQEVSPQQRQPNQNQDEEGGGGGGGPGEEITTTGSSERHYATPSTTTTANNKIATTQSNIVRTSNKVKESIVDTFRDFSLFDVEKQRKKRRRLHKRIKSKLIEYKLSIMFVLYIVVGWVFYDINEGIGTGETPNGIGGYYQSITIGYSVGLAPRNPAYFPNPWFSSAYILVGATLIAVILNSMGQSMDKQSSLSLFEDLKRLEKYQTKLNDSERPFLKKVKLFIRYNAGYLITVLLWILWLIFIIIWSMHATKEWDEPWDFKKAQYFAISTCSSAGAFSLPDFSPYWAYGMAGLSMMIGVPLMALAISSIVIMTGIAGTDNYPEKVRKAAWTPITQKELHLLQHIGLGQSLSTGPTTMIDGEVISKGDYVLLGVLRMGTEAGLIRYFCDAYDTALEERGCVPMETTAKQAAATTKRITKNNENTKTLDFSSSEDDYDENQQSIRRQNLSSCAASYVTEEESYRGINNNSVGVDGAFSTKSQSTTNSTFPMTTTTTMMMGSIPEDSTFKSTSSGGGGDSIVGSRGGPGVSSSIVTNELGTGSMLDRVGEKNQMMGNKQWSTLVSKGSGDNGDDDGGSGVGGPGRPSMDLSDFSMANLPPDDYYSARSITRGDSDNIVHNQNSTNHLEDEKNGEKIEGNER